MSEKSESTPKSPADPEKEKTEKEDDKSRRILDRKLARELTSEELEQAQVGVERTGTLDPPDADEID